MNFVTSSTSKRLGQQLDLEVKKILGEQWSVRDGQKVPESEDLQLGNDAAQLGVIPRLGKNCTLSLDRSRK